MTSSYSWRYVLEALGARFRVVAPDLPGCGRTEPPQEGRYGARELATWLGELARALGIYGCDAIGNSLGGYVCMRLALDDPSAVRRLVNIHSPGLPEARLRALSFALGVPGVRSILAWWVRRRPLRWAHANVHYFDETLKSLEEAREYGQPLATAAGARVFTRYLADTLAPSDLREFVEELTQRRDRKQAFPVPLLLVYARRDPMVPPEIGPKLQALVPDAELRWLEDSSHFAHVDTPDPLVSMVLDFLR
jgi:pimeloyl-ACP methyl ester carboxylesterase